jgi:hypothetical protein
MSKLLQRSWMVLLVVALLSLIGPFPRAIHVAAGDSRYFPETHQTSSNAFYTFWLSHGQTEILGLPITPPYHRKDDTLQQIYERAVMEWHPENTNANRVQLQLLGSSDLDGITSAKDNTSTDCLKTARSVVVTHERRLSGGLLSPRGCAD